MKNLVLEGKILSVGSSFGGTPRVVVGIPIDPEELEEGEDPDYTTLECEVTEDIAREFGPHVFDRVRVRFELIPTPKIVPDDEENSNRTVHHSGKTCRVQIYDEEV